MGLKVYYGCGHPRFSGRRPAEGTIGKENTSKSPQTPKITAAVDMHYWDSPKMQSSKEQVSPAL